MAGVLLYLRHSLLRIKRFLYYERQSHPELEQPAHGKVQSGRYNFASEVVREALRLMEERDLRREEIRKKIAQSLDSQRVGRLTDGETVFDRLEWIVDFGLRAYCEKDPPPGTQVGPFVSGEIDLGIDYYIYMEFLRDELGFPALNYHWRIDRILQLAAPFIPTTTPWGAPARMRDMDKATYTPIEHTSAWQDDDGFAEYILPVSKLACTSCG
jgi:putative addiction module CopG family antidote